MPRPHNAYLSTVPSLLTTATQAVFDRAITRALSGLKGSAAPLRRVIAVAMRELSDKQINAAAALDHLNAMVEDAGRGGVGDRMSLMSGRPRWMAVRDQVLDEARATLAPEPVV